MGNKIDYEYAAFEALMDEGRIFADESLSFNDICALIGADAQALEQKIADELGYLGDELLCDFFFLHLKPCLFGTDRNT